MLTALTEFKGEFVLWCGLMWVFPACTQVERVSQIIKPISFSRLVCDRGKVGFTLDSVSLGIVRGRQSTQCKKGQYFHVAHLLVVSSNAFNICKLSSTIYSWFKVKSLKFGAIDLLNECSMYTV